jgi:hypothetical protein
MSGGSRPNLPATPISPSTPPQCGPGGRARSNEIAGLLSAAGFTGIRRPRPFGPLSPAPSLRKSREMTPVRNVKKNLSKSE